jgi:hypothetical protein
MQFTKKGLWRGEDIDSRGLSAGFRVSGNLIVPRAAGPLM